MQHTPCDKNPGGAESAAFMVYRTDRPSPVMVLCRHHYRAEVPTLAASPVAYFAMPVYPLDADLPDIDDVVYWGIPAAEAA